MALNQTVKDEIKDWLIHRADQIGIEVADDNPELLALVEFIATSTDNTAIQDQVVTESHEYSTE